MAHDGPLHTPPSAPEATFSPPSNASGTVHIDPGATGSAYESTMTSTKAVRWPPLTSRARTVTRTGSLDHASGGTSIVMGTETVPPAGTLTRSCSGRTSQAHPLATPSSESSRSVAAEDVIDRAPARL